ncbi:HNH endonuclease [Sphingomonas parva]|uniref:HNH endonuclease n=2 Tax=Sphingomonas parva TaxID=2555898 RepID=A0A4Y8ZXA0_9SPHN|nr:HNH endonuclease [Sphingomonas parva]
MPEQARDAAAACFLCARALGRRIEYHHPVPKSRGGRDTVPVHPICHRAIHAAIDNKALARDFADAEALRNHPDIARFLLWIADKPPDFHAPTRRRKT